MLLSITCEHEHSQELSWLFHKNPDKIQSFNIIAGKAFVFYPEYSDKKVKICLALDIDTVTLVRKLKLPLDSHLLQHYVNDRPYVVSSFMSTAISNVFSSALNGNCKDKPELIDVIFPFEVEISVLKVIGGESLIKKFFEPLGYEVETESFNLDEKFENWGKSRYYKVKLKNNLTLKDLLSHLYVLIPTFDMEKHFYIGNIEAENFLKKGESWLKTHPEKETIIKRYFRKLGKYSNYILSKLNENQEDEEKELEIDIEVKKKKESLQTIRINTIFDKLCELGTKTVADVGCGEGKLLRLLKNKPQFQKICGTDVVYKNLIIAKDKLDLDEVATHNLEKINIFQSSILYKDDRLKEYETICLIEVIEHIEEDRIVFLEKIVFGYLNTKNVLISTPNSEYNNVYMPENSDSFRHEDHRFEWNREEFKNWVEKICNNFNYNADFFGIGDYNEQFGYPTQAVILKRN